MYFDRQGQPISEDDYLRLIGDMEYRRISADTVDGILISTIWLGLEHGRTGGHPLIFESWVFDKSGRHDWCSGYMVRYTSLDHALRGHMELYVAVNQRLVSGKPNYIFSAPDLATLSGAEKREFGFEAG